MKHFALIAAGGNGTRMQSQVPKQFLLLSGKPVLMRTIEKFIEADLQIQIILVLPETEIPEWKKLCASFSFSVSHQIVAGGASRFQSVKNGLGKIDDENSIVAIHDGVRPLASVELIKRCFAEAEKSGNAVPVTPLKESLRKKETENSAAVDRNNFLAVQTPQCFKAGEIKRAYSAAKNDSFTDDASVCENAGMKIHLIEGEETNIKITTPFDLEIAELIFGKQKKL